MYDNVTINTPELTLPHPLMRQRRFVMEPLAQIAPELTES
jgi:2-amino-4-hydroxy-6-hydroxymethyldihydropteridine diphosphokinase